jgi:nicotinamide phosphoribosyltransferase
MKTNLILNADSYKASHYKMYPENTTGQYAYIEARVKNETIIPFGLQMAIKKYLLTPVTLDDIEEAEELLPLHGLPFNREGWLKIVNEYNGLLPITIKGVLEGTPTQSSTPIVTIECEDDELFWLPSYIETWLQRAIWYPSTIASNDYKNYKILKESYDRTSDNVENIVYSYHSFGSRGVTSEESAEVGGLAHLLYFKGTDDLPAIRAAKEYYGVSMAGFSIPATEHSVQCAYGDANQLDYLKTVINSCKSGDIVSIVLDGYDIFRDTELLCKELKDHIIESGVKIVVRLDSGDAYEVAPKVIDIIESYFGHTVNSKGFKVLNHVSLIQGDGIDTPIMKGLCSMIELLGYAAETLVYGSGGGLLQKVNRDTYSFAQKTSAMKINGVWVDTVKNPITSRAKKSKGGRFDDLNLTTYYHNGKLLVNDDLNTIRERLFS